MRASGLGNGAQEQFLRSPLKITHRKSEGKQVGKKTEEGLSVSPAVSIIDSRESARQSALY